MRPGLAICAAKEGWGRLHKPDYDYSAHGHAILDYDYSIA